MLHRVWKCPLLHAHTRSRTPGVPPTRRETKGGGRAGRAGVRGGRRRSKRHDDRGLDFDESGGPARPAPTPFAADAGAAGRWRQGGLGQPGHGQREAPAPRCPRQGRPRPETPATLGEARLWAGRPAPWGDAGDATAQRRRLAPRSLTSGDNGCEPEPAVALPARGRGKQITKILTKQRNYNELPCVVTEFCRRPGEIAPRPRAPDATGKKITTLRNFTQKITVHQ